MVLFGFVVFKVLDANLSFCEFGDKVEIGGCVFVKENLLPSEGFASHPITLRRTKGKQESREGSYSDCF